MAEQDAGAAHALFFVGNCQVQFFARHLTRSLPATAFCLGEGQVPYDGRLRELGSPAAVLAESRRQRRAGRSSTLLYQEPLLAGGPPGFGEAEFGAFDAVIRVPVVHFRSIWPNHYAGDTMAPTPRTVARMFEREREKVDESAARCGGGRFDREAFWRLVLDAPVFYHPGHTDARVHRLVYDAFVREGVARLAGEARADAVAASIAASPGLPLTSLHPINPVWGDAVGARWHRHPAYARWAAITRDEARLAESGACATGVARAFGPAMGALCAYDLSKRLMSAGRLTGSTRLAIRAARVLPMIWPVLGHALAAAYRARNLEEVTGTLDAARAYLETGSALASKARKWFAEHETAQARLPADLQALLSG